MSDILEEIQALQEKFSNLFEAEKEDLKTYQNNAAKDIMDKLGLDIKGYIKRITPIRDYKELEQHKQRKVKEFAADQLSPYEKVKGIKLTDREHPLDKHKGTIEAHRKEIQDTAKEYKTGDDSVAKSIIKGKKKMNDNNSYNEILTQIMDLQEAFSSLFEVEGLGEPSSDVPPSTNKIKRDRKTKDGKVEVVSVEDELFPYDGNKREQYRQKILDTINGMIQGTATLEDLLQIVRQKKAPLKEAMELLEELLSEEKTSTNDYHEKKAKIKKAIEKRYPDILKSYFSGVDPIAKGERDKLEGSWEKAQDKQYQQEMKRGIGKGRLWNPTKNDKGDYKTRERSQADNETGGFKYKSHEDTVKGSQRRNAEKNIKQLTSQIKKAAKEFDNLYMQKQTDPNIDLHPAAHKEGNLRTEKAKQEARLSKLGEALSLMEDIVSFIKKKHGEPEFKPNSNIAIPLNKSAELINKAGDIMQKEYSEEIKKNPDINLYDKRYQNKNKKGERKTENRSSQYRRFTDDWKLPKTDDEKIEASVERHEKKVQKKNSLEEALRILEGMFIDDGREDLITGKTPGIKVIQKGIASAMKNGAKQQKATTIQKRTLPTVKSAFTNNTTTNNNTTNSTATNSTNQPKI